MVGTLRAYLAGVVAQRVRDREKAPQRAAGYGFAGPYGGDDHASATVYAVVSRPTSDRPEGGWVPDRSMGNDVLFCGPCLGSIGGEWHPT